MKTNKTVLCSAVATAIGFAGTAQSVQAFSPSVLLPYVVKDSNRTTVVTLIGYGVPASQGAELHLQYWTKSTTDANTAACQPSSVTVPFTDNDIMTFDTAGLLGYPLFGDTTNAAPLGVSISYPGPRHGYLVAEWLSEVPIAGYWLELDLANGGAHGDAGLRSVYGGEGQGDFVLGEFYNSFWDWISTWAPFGSEGLITPLHGLLSNAENVPAGFDFGGEGARGPRAVNFWPTSVASTAFTVTPLGTGMITKENNQVTVQVFNSNLVQGAYDRNENGVDGTVPLTIRCVGRVTPSQLMPGIVANSAWAAQGGWGFLANLGDGDTNYTELYLYVSSDSNSSSFSGLVIEDLPALVYQVDSSSAGGKFMTNATRIESKDHVKSAIGEFFFPL